MLTAERLRELLNYDENTGVFRWRTKTSNRAIVGSPAGCLSLSRGGHRRIEIRLDGKLYKAHRLVWLYVHGRWPADQIDHIDADPTNNRISNLRECNNQQNHYNLPTRRTNKTGYKGVCYVAARRRFHAYIRVEGRNTFLGSFSTAEQAHEAYKTATKKFHGDFARAG